MRAADLFARNQGQTITRAQTCECGDRFTQMLLSEAFLASCESTYAGRAMALVRQQIPDFYVPVHCPKCERVELGRQQRIAMYRDEAPDHRVRAAGEW